MRKSAKLPGNAYRQYDHRTVTRANSSRALRALINSKVFDARFIMIVVSLLYSVVEVLYGHLKPGFRHFDDNHR